MDLGLTGRGLAGGPRAGHLPRADRACEALRGGRDRATTVGAPELAASHGIGSGARPAETAA